MSGRARSKFLGSVFRAPVTSRHEGPKGFGGHETGHDLDIAVTEGSLAAIRERYNRMDLDDLRGMPKVSGGKTPSAHAAVLAREVGVSPAREAPKTSSKRPTDTSTEQIDDLARRHKKVKILSRRHKSCHGEGGSRSHSKGKEPAIQVEEPETFVESAEEDASPVFHRSRSMKDLFKTKMGEAEELDEGLVRLVDREGVRKGTPAPAIGAGAVYAPIGGTAGPSCQRDGSGNVLTLISMSRASLRFCPDDCCFVQNQHVQMALFDRVHDAGRLITFMDYRITSLQQEIDALKSRGAFDKELNEARSDLSEVQKLLKEARVRARKMDDELLQSVKALESARAELPRQAVDDYKESAGFKEGLKRMGRVTYEYGYRVALARFRSLHPDSEVEEDPFTIRPKDNSVPMEKQQAFDGSDPPES
ncbi:hypothetical protein B296_00044465 [Ensete ventricosum]|uniref:Uncharacterized protein n=1 Tax=Ensete ventricosum TaxID=4639 RepID=A0A426XIK3_ENSVE|nr:hypothetical protein B296_00044465 [Ensete ventricosum]